MRTFTPDGTPKALATRKFIENGRSWIRWSCCFRCLITAVIVGGCSECEEGVRGDSESVNAPMTQAMGRRMIQRHSDEASPSDNNAS